MLGINSVNDNSDHEFKTLLENSILCTSLDVIIMAISLFLPRFINVG